MASTIFLSKKLNDFQNSRFSNCWFSINCYVRAAVARCSKTIIDNVKKNILFTMVYLDFAFLFSLAQKMFCCLICYKY